jgi:hypothetical protein
MALILFVVEMVQNKGNKGGTTPRVTKCVSVATTAQPVETSTVQHHDIANECVSTRSPSVSLFDLTGR